MQKAHGVLGGEYWHGCAGAVGQVKEASIAGWVRQSCELPDADRTFGETIRLAGVACLRSGFAIGNKAAVGTRVKHTVLT